jgi:hypothetical protein
MPVSMRVILLVSASTTPDEARRAAATFAFGRNLERVDVLSIRSRAPVAQALPVGADGASPADRQLTAIAHAVARELAPRGTAVAARSVVGRLAAALRQVVRDMQTDTLVYVKPRRSLLSAWRSWVRMVRVVNAAPLPIWVV